MIRRKYAVLSLAIMICILVGCANGGKVNQNLTATEVGERIQQEVNLSEMRQGDNDTLKRMYRINADEVENFVLYSALSNVKAEELVVIKVKDASDIESVLDQMRQRIEAQILKFKDYRPEEYALIDKHVLKTKDRFIFYAVSKDVGLMERMFDEALK